MQTAPWRRIFGLVFVVKPTVDCLWRSLQPVRELLEDSVVVFPLRDSKIRASGTPKDKPAFAQNLPRPSINHPKFFRKYPGEDARCSGDSYTIKHEKSVHSRILIFGLKCHASLASDKR